MALVAAVVLPNSCNKPPKVETDRNLHILIPDPDETIYENSSIDDFLDSYEELIKPSLTIVLYLSFICLTVLLIFKLCRTMKNSDSKDQKNKEHTHHSGGRDPMGRNDRHEIRTP